MNYSGARLARAVSLCQVETTLVKNVDMECHGFPPGV